MADETPQIVAPKERHWMLSRKWLAYLFTSGTLVISALIVKNNNYTALATALVASMTAFCGTNTIAGLKAQNTAKSQEDAD